METQDQPDRSDHRDHWDRSDHNARSDEPPRADLPLIGVRGWLLGLVVILIVIGPAITIYFNHLDMAGVASLYPDIVFDPVWQRLVATTWTIVALQCAISILAGLLLKYRMRGSTPAIATWLIWLCGPVFSVAGRVVLAYVADVPFDWPRALYAVIVTAIFCAAYTLYLDNSKRVANTYAGDRRTTADTFA